MTEFMSTVSAGVPVILLFLTRSSKEFEEKSGSSKTFVFSQTNYHLTKGFPYVFIAYLNPKSNSSVKQFPSLSMGKYVAGGSWMKLSLNYIIIFTVFLF